MPHRWDRSFAQSISARRLLARFHTAARPCRHEVYLDTSPFLWRGLSECLLGVALRGVPRDRYLLGTKLGRYDASHFDFSARRVVESIGRRRLHRMGVHYLDIVLCHDIEFVGMQQIVDETLPTLRKIQQQGKVRFVDISGYPMNIFRYILDRTELDVILSYNHYTLQNTMLADLVPYLQTKGVGIMNAAPFSARLLTNSTLPAWHKATYVGSANIRRRAAEHYARARMDNFAQLALQYSLANPDLATCIVGSANPDNVRKWAAWADLPLDQKSS